MRYKMANENDLHFKSALATLSRHLGVSCGHIIELGFFSPLSYWIKRSCVHVISISSFPLTDRVCHQQGLSLWVPFQNSATAVTNLYKGIWSSFPLLPPLFLTEHELLMCYQINVSLSLVSSRSESVCLFVETVLWFIACLKRDKEDRPGHC